MKKITKSILFNLLATLTLVPVAFALDEELPRYQPANLEPTELTSVGSDVMDELMTAWVETYQRIQPNVKIGVVSQGSATAPAALIDGSADIGPMSRPMKTPEAKNFMRKYGFQPAKVSVAMAPLVFYVSPNNPIKSLSLTQLERIYSADPIRSEKSAALNWGDLGVEGEFSKKKIMAISQSPVTVSYAFFKQRVLLLNELGSDINTVTSHRALEMLVQASENAIGFSMGLKPNSRLKVLALSARPGLPAVLPTKDTLVSDEYPLNRYLNMYFVAKSGEPTDPALRDFLSFILSKDGQRLVEEKGLQSIPAWVSLRERAKIQ